VGFFVNKFDGQSTYGVLAAPFGFIVLFNPPFYIQRNAGIKRIIRASKDVYVPHIKEGEH
jgi:hypothetical protein